MPREANEKLQKAATKTAYARVRGGGTNHHSGDPGGPDDRDPPKDGLAPSEP